jgi:hypothetical protein
MCEDYMEEITNKYLLKDTQPVILNNGNLSMNVHSPHLQSE